MSEWISIKDRLPNVYQPVALLDVRRFTNTGCDVHLNHHNIGYLVNHGHKYWSLFTSPSSDLTAFTHCMPLPTLPKEQA